MYCSKSFSKWNSRSRFCSRRCAVISRPKKTTCSICGGPRGHYKLGTHCTSCATKATYKNALEKFGSQRARYLWFRYGITIEEFERLLKAQDGKCAACRKRAATQVDHDHATNLVRGLLCRPCNRTLGTIGDDVEAAARLLDYATNGAERVGVLLKRKVGLKHDRRARRHFELAAAA